MVSKRNKSSRNYLATLIAILLIQLPFFSRAQPLLEFNNVASGLSGTLDITNAGDGSNRLFIVQREGQILIYDGSTVLSTPFLDISSVVNASGGEQGLLSVAFHPGYATNRYFFVYYINTDGDLVIARYQTEIADPNTADPNSGTVILTIPNPLSGHNGGNLLFGPDGDLYIGTGDGDDLGGDNANAAQDGNNLLGKILRINVDNFTTPPFYTIPSDNPFVSNAAVDDRIWAIGLRNPWRWSFDKTTHDMWVADVGQDAWEELNYRAMGSTGGINYGWHCYEGNDEFNISGCAPPANYVFPVFTYPHDNTTGGFAITGGFVYRGSQYPSLQGYYICADFISGNVWLLSPDGSNGWIITQQTGLPGFIASFGEAENGEIYAVSLGGEVYKVGVSTVLPLTLVSFTGTPQNGYNELKWKTSFEQNLLSFMVEYSADGINFQSLAQVPATNHPSGSEYLYRHYTNTDKKWFYRVRIRESGRADRFSPIISLGGGGSDVIRVYPSVITNGEVQISSTQPVSAIQVLDNNGRLISAKQVGHQRGYFSLSLPRVPKGIYLLRVITESGQKVMRVAIE